MAQSVTYADLRFMKVPLGSTVSSRSPEAEPAAEDDAELTYENIHMAQAVEVRSQQGAEQSKAHGWSTWYLPVSLLGACLFLLATTIGLGVRYWQVSQQLQQASRAHVAESSRLSQQVSAKEETLGQRASDLERTQSQLEQARQELEQTWREGNKTQEQSRQQALKLEGTQADLARVQQQLRETEEKLNQTETALSNIRPCEQTDCCPEDWLLFRGKCLFVSKEKKSWDKSKEDCEGKRAQLLITKSWDSWTMPNFLRNSEVQYWIGAKGRWMNRRSWELEWHWIDDSSVRPGTFEDDKTYKTCGVIKSGNIQNDGCYSAKLWICEKAPSPGASFPFS